MLTWPFRRHHQVNYALAIHLTEYGLMAAWPLALRLATADHLPEVVGLIEDRARWLRDEGFDQWRRPWPTYQARNGRILAGLEANQTWIGWDDQTPAATITADPRPNMAWPERLSEDPAVYLHRLVVDLEYSHAGLGGQLIDWAGWTARRQHGSVWIRVNAWTTNQRLHGYYQKQGFEFCGTCSDEGYPSGAMFQKPTEFARPPDPALLFVAEPPILG